MDRPVQLQPDSRSATHEIQLSFMQPPPPPKVHYRVHKSPPWTLFWDIFKFSPQLEYYEFLQDSF
jgi:hypothetical protein